MTELLQRLGQRIRELRNQKGWSQEEFADVCGVHRTYMGHLERGEKNVSFRSIVRVAKALKVTLSELFAGLESGESAVQPSGVRGRSQAAVPEAEMDRGRILREVAALERAARTLKDIALKPGEQPSPRPRSHKRKKGLVA